MFLLNAFSLNMVDCTHDGTMQWKPVIVEDVAKVVKGGITSGIGHQQTAGLFSTVLGVPVAMNRISVLLKRGDSAIIGQYVGPRLPEGVTELPEGSMINWVHVWIT